MTAAPPVLAGSRWNNLFELDGRWVVVNSITMRAAVVDAELAGVLASGGPIAASPAVESLRRLGIVAPAPDDERLGLEALGSRSWAGPILDLFSIGPATLLGSSPAKQIAQIAESISAARRVRDIRTVKLRLSGASGAHVRRNTEILSAIGALCRDAGLELVSLLMSDALDDALACGEAPADAFFFRWRPVSAERDGPALDALRGLVRRGKLVAVQLAVRGVEALRPHEAWLRQLAADALLVRSPNAAWDVGLDDAERPYFLASVCHREDDRARELEAARGLVTALGIPIRPALAPFQFHPGCPVLLPEAQIIMPTGRRVLCNDDVRTSDAGFDPKPASQARVAEQLARSCARCAVLPFCLSRCPKLPAPVPDSPACEEVKRGARVELRRLLESGQLRPEPAIQNGGAARNGGAAQNGGAA